MYPDRDHRTPGHSASDFTPRPDLVAMARELRDELANEGHCVDFEAFERDLAEDES